MSEHTCENCGSHFESHATWARYCSICKQRRWTLGAMSSYRCIYDPSEFRPFEGGVLTKIQMEESLKQAVLPEGSAWIWNMQPRRIRLVRGLEWHEESRNPHHQKLWRAQPKELEHLPHRVFASVQR